MSDAQTAARWGLGAPGTREAASLSVIMRRFSFVKEVDGPNVGTWVSLFQRFCDGVAGDSWCADLVSFCLDVAYRGHSPLVRSGSTVLLLTQARAKRWIVTTPQVDDLFFYVNAAGVPHHVGAVTRPAPLAGIAGNTSADGRSSNGDGVYEHALTVARDRIVFVRLPKVY